jgi:hypothetical protein
MIMSEPREESEIVVVESTEQAVQLYEFTPAEVRAQLAQYRDLQFGTPREYEAGRKAIATCRDLRLSFDEKRKQLNEKALEHTRMVNATGKALMEAVTEVEKPLKDRKDAADAEKARVKAAREAEELRVQLAREQAAREEEEARIAAEAAAALETKVRAALAMPMDDWLASVESGDPEYVLGSGEATLSICAPERAHPLVVTREAECRAILRERKAAEQARLAAERAELDRQRQALEAEKARQAAALAERERVARETREAEERKLAEAHAALEAASARQRAETRAAEARIAAEQRRLYEQKCLAELAEAERKAKLQAEQEAAEQAERDRIAEEEAAVREAERQAALARRLEALRPERERVLAYVDDLLGFARPELVDSELSAIIETLVATIREAREQVDGVAGEVAA